MVNLIEYIEKIKKELHIPSCKHLVYESSKEHIIKINGTHDNVEGLPSSAQYVTSNDFYMIRCVITIPQKTSASSECTVTIRYYYPNILKCKSLFYYQDFKELLSGPKSPNKMDLNLLGNEQTTIELSEIDTKLPAIYEQFVNKWKQFDTIMNDEDILLLDSELRKIYDKIRSLNKEENVLNDKLSKLLNTKIDLLSDFM